MDPRTGENLGTFRPELRRKRVTNSGLITFSGDDRVEVYSAKDGKIIDVPGDMVAAASGDAIVVIDRARGVEALTRPCTYRGYGPGSRLRWTSAGYQRGVTAPYRQYGKAISSDLELSEMPEVLVTMTAPKGGATVLHSPADGRRWPAGTRCAAPRTARTAWSRWPWMPGPARRAAGTPNRTRSGPATPSAAARCWSATGTDDSGRSAADSDHA